MRTAGAGGVGDPATREAEHVLRDVRAGLISVDAARDLYKAAVVGTPPRLDRDATGLLRSRRRASAAIA